MKKNNIANAAVGLIFLTFISKVLGFVREMVISYMYGASDMSDAYSMANSVAVLIVAGIANGIMTAYIPDCMGIPGKDERDGFTSVILNIIIVGGGLLGIIGILFAGPIVSVLGMGFTESVKGYTTILFRFIVAASLCMLVIYIINGYLNTRQNYSYGGWQLVITNLIVIAAVLVSEKNPWKLGTGYLAAYIVPLFLGLFLLKKYGLNYKWKLDFKDSRLKKLFFASIIAFLGTSIVKIDVMIDRFFASSLPEGTVAAMNYAFTLIAICPEVFIMPIVTVGYPRLSEWFAYEKKEKAGNYIKEMLISTIMILLPVTVIFLGMGRWIVQILFQRGAFDWADTLLTTDILRGYSYSMLGIGTSYVLCKVFFARKEEWIPAICLGAGIVMNVFLNIIIGQTGGYQLAWTTSISVTVSVILMLAVLVKKCPEIDIKGVFVSGMKILVSVGLMESVVFVGMKACVPLEYGGAIIKVLALGIIAVISMAIYLVALYIFRVEEIKGIILILRQKLKGKITG